MRTVLAVALAAAACSASAQENEAERLFGEMEAALAGAATLDLAFETTYGEANLRKGQRLKGTLAVGGENQLRLAVTGGKAGATVHLQVSDGTRSMLRVEGEDEARFRPASKTLGANYRAVVARSGVLPALLARGYEHANGGGSYKEFHPVSGIIIGGREKVGGREARRVDYVLGVKGEKATYPASVWIDPETRLPVKRVVSDGGSPWFTETYELTLGGKLDPGLFVLPR
ncbi:MAG TPA: hypothetical protein VH092_08735 [Urbifossiella sp.]|jgi:outer membrane lipoprotein-sorting protein|nr:hypothetical protein [Urbifossiella sp.]